MKALALTPALSLQSEAERKPHRPWGRVPADTGLGR